MNMEVEQTNPSSHNEDQAVDNDRGNWRRRLRLRKSSALSHTVKSSIEKQKVDKELTKESSQNEQKDHEVVETADSKLTFTCSDCKDGTRFSADGLLKHFKSFHGGKGQPPSFPCDRCNFVASDFITLQQHYLKHKHSRLTNEACNDEGLQTQCRPTKHCKTHNEYQCEMFRTKDLTHFIHTSCPHSTVAAVDSSEKLDIKPVNGELNRNLLADAAGEPQKDTLLKHMTTTCNRGWSRKNWWKNRAVSPKQPEHTAPDIKFLIPKSEIPWTSAKFLPFSAAGLIDENGELLHPTQTLEETKQFLEKTVNCGKKWPMTLKGEADLSFMSCPGPFRSEPKMKQCVTPLPVLNSGNDLSDLMEKNNITVPPDCTTKVVGFKMVDGKKHLVLKVIPSAKPEVSSDTGEKPAIVNQEEKNETQLNPHIERPSDQMCSEPGNMTTADSAFNGYDSTSPSHQDKKQGLGEEDTEDQHTTEDASQVDNTQNDCSDDQCAFSDTPDAPAQLTYSGIEEVFNVVSQMTNEIPASPEVMLNANETNDLNGENADVLEEACSVRKAAIQTLKTNMQEIRDTPQQTDNQEQAAGDYKGINSEPSASQDDMSRIEHLASGTSSDFGSVEEGTGSQLLTLMSERDTSTDVYMKNMDTVSGEEATIIQSALDYWNEQKALNSPTNKNERDMLELNIIDPTVASPHKITTDSLFISLSEHGSLFFQDSGDGNINRYVPALPEQNSMMEAVEESYLALLSLEDSCHDPDLSQTLEELPVTTVSHLLDDSEVTYRDITSQSEPGNLATHQVGMHSLKAIPEAAVNNDKASSQLPLMTEPTIKPPTTKDSQGRILRSKRRLVRNSQENESLASIPYWEPLPPQIERTLRLFPVRPSQPVKVPRLNQPVVVLNHPDTDIPEVTNIMRSVHRHKEAVQRVVLSQGTLKALSEFNCDTLCNIRTNNLQSSHYRRAWPQGTVKERFVLKLKLKRLGGNRFKVANLSTNANQSQPSFRCWFCGRYFRNQEVWVGHGQRHIMEATRDWNKLFNSEGQGNATDQQSFS